MPPKKREAFIGLEKIALRCRKKENPLATQKELAVWLENEFKKPIAQNSVSEILSNQYKDLDNTASNVTSHLQHKKACHHHHPDLEAALFTWHLKMEQKGVITCPLLKEKALFFWTELPQYHSCNPPAFSDGWLTGFKERYNIKNCNHHHGEAGSVDTTAVNTEMVSVTKEVLSLFSLWIANISFQIVVTQELHQYKLDDQYNCDETGVFWMLVPERSLTTQELAGTKKDKHHVTLNFACNASGTHKLKPWVIGHAMNPQCFKAAGVRIHWESWH